MITRSAPNPLAMLTPLRQFLPISDIPATAGQPTASVDRKVPLALTLNPSPQGRGTLKTVSGSPLFVGEAGWFIRDGPSPSYRWYLRHFW